MQTTSPSSSAPLRTQDESAAAAVASRIRAEILSGAIAPGERIRFERLRDTLGGSMGLLREALTRLEAEGLVRGTTGRGFSAAPVSLADLTDIENVRLTIEVGALRASIANGGDDWEADLVAAYHRVAMIEERAMNDRSLLDAAWDDRHRAFHYALIAACGSPWTLHFCGLLFEQGRRYRRLLAGLPTSPLRKRDEHRRLLDAALSRDVEAAAATLAAHIRHTRELLASRLS